MAVKEALLAIMTLGPAYGLQLHAELGVRAPHRARTNVGQIYGTLDRLVNTGLVTRSEATAEGLPQYSLTVEGVQAAARWLSGQDLVSASEWPELLDRVLIARSLNDDVLEDVLGAFERILSVDPPYTPRAATGQDALWASSRARFANAALAWLGDVRREKSQRSIQAYTDESDASRARSGASQGYQVLRPKRGRPATVAATA